MNRLTLALADIVDQRSDLLVIIDVQKDFLPGGALAVPKGDEILPVIDEVAMCFNNVVVTQDWHPAGHSSFASTHGAQPFETFDASYGPQVLWPDHCVIGSEGAKLQLNPYTIRRAQMTLRKGFRKDVDSYSAFIENDQKTLTGLSGFMRDRGLKRAFFVGLATDYCVGFSALDARKMGFEAVVIEPACRGIAEESIAERIEDMRADGVRILF